jgi:periplasmic copper chaperone A
VRLRPAYIAAAIALVLGAAGLGIGAFAADTPAAVAAAGGSDSGPPDGVSAGDITVSGAYVRQPASPDVIAAYLSITNSGTEPDTLVAISTGAAKSATLHDVPGVPGVTPNGSPAPTGTEHRPTGPLTIAPGATITLSPGLGHIMLENPTGTLKVGDRVSLNLTFQRSGQILVEAPVIAIGAPAPTGGTR